MLRIPHYREILRLTSAGRRQRQIESSMHSSHQTISEVQKAAREKLENSMMMQLRLVLRNFYCVVVMSLD